MSVFLDSNVFLYAATEDSERGASCMELVAAAGAGDLDAKTSTAALEEVWHVELRSGGTARGIADGALRTMDPVLPVTHRDFERALSLPVGRMGANDRLHAATCLNNGIDVIVTADRAFDELDLPRRLDPVDAAAELLG